MRTNLRTEHGGEASVALVQVFLVLVGWFGFVFLGGGISSETQFIVCEEAQNTLMKNSAVVQRSLSQV